MRLALWRAVDKLCISALLTATYISTSHSPLVARLDLHHFSTGPSSIELFNSLLERIQPDENAT
jgi:hypothetical protein